GVGVKVEGITPYLEYEDAAAMLDWLSNVFGFQERSRFVDKDGVVQQAEMYAGEVEIWLGGHRKPESERPNPSIIVWVDDVDARYERVQATGAHAEPPRDETYDVRSLRVQDPEGYNWNFVRRLGTGYIQTRPLEEGGLKEVRPA